MQADRDYIGVHKLEFLPWLKRWQKYPSPTSMTHVIWVIEAISMTTIFVRSYNLACKAFLYLTSINSSSCLSKAKIIIGDLNPACWWVPVEQSITFVSKLRFCDEIVTKVLQKWPTLVLSCDKSDKNVTKNGPFEATEVSLPSNVDLISDLPNLWHPNQQACTPIDLNWQIKFRNNLVSHLWQKKNWNVKSLTQKYATVWFSSHATLPDFEDELLFFKNEDDRLRLRTKENCDTRYFIKSHRLRQVSF